MDTVLAMMFYLKTCARTVPKRPLRTPAREGTDEPPGPAPRTMPQTLMSVGEVPHDGVVEAISALEACSGRVGSQGRGCRGVRAREASLDNGRLEGRDPRDEREAG